MAAPLNDITAPTPTSLTSSVSSTSISAEDHCLYVRFSATHRRLPPSSRDLWFSVVGLYPPHIFQLRNWLRDPPFHQQLKTDLAFFIGLEITGSFTDVAATLYVSVLWKTTEVESEKVQIKREREELKDAMKGLFSKYNRKFRPKKRRSKPLRPPLVPHTIITCTKHQQLWFESIMEEVTTSCGGCS